MKLLLCQMDKQNKMSTSYLDLLVLIEKLTILNFKIMKKKSILKYLLFFSTIFLLQSCDEDTNIYEEGELSWQNSTVLKVTPVEDKETFIWYKDLLTFEEYWGNETVELNMKLRSELSADQFSKVDFYVTVEEKDGYNYTAPFDRTGKMLTSVDIPESGEFSLALNATDAYALFINDFQTDRSSKLPVADDFFLVYWVITAKDGSTLDSRSVANNDRYAIKVRVEDYAPPVWAGDYNYEIIDVGYNCGGSNAIGTTGTISIAHLGTGVYRVSSLTFNYCYSGAGNIVFDFLDGLTYVDPNNDYDDVVWNISNINGTSLDIYWTYKWTANYGEWSKVRLTRTDGVNWPTNIYTN